MKRSHAVTCSLAIALSVTTLSNADTTFNGSAEYSTDAHGLYYAITGGKFVNGQTVNGDNASGGVFRFITDDPNNGYTIDEWIRDDWFTENAGLAMTLQNNGATIYDNNGIETGTTNGFYDDTQTSIAGLYMAYAMSNNYDWIYSGYFKLNQQTEIDTIIGYFDGNGFNNNLDPNDPAFAYRMNIFSSVNGVDDNAGYLMPANTGSFTGDVFSSDNTPGTFSWSDTGEVRSYSGWPAGTTDPIYRLVYTLDTPIILEPGEYFFSHDASIVPTPAAFGAGLLGLIAVASRRR